MRLATIRTTRGARLFVRAQGGYVDVADATGEESLSSLNGLIEAGEWGREHVTPLTLRDGTVFEPAQFAAATPDPPRVLCLGVNYADHAVEGGRAVPTWPEVFVRGAGSVLGPYDDLVRPSLSERFDYEAELGVVIGLGGRYLRAEGALSAVFGYAVLNDASAREWQRAATQWTPGKNFEGSMPIGPEVVTADEVDPSDLAISSTLNGQVMQSARTSQMIVDVPHAIEYLSGFTRLRPGDVIATGTPGGVGFARIPPVWLRDGDVIEVSVEGVGTISNRVVDEVGAPSDWPWNPSPATTSSF